MDGVTTMVEAGRHRIEATVFGAGLPVVVIEPAFGGRAQAWRAIAEALAAGTTVVTYDRAAYGASSRALDRRTAGDVAADLHSVLESLAIRGPLVLVGHSLGGVYVRGYAARHMERVAGMVLVDSTHEAQHPVLRERYSLPRRARLALTIPELILRSRQWRGGADRRSIIREYRVFTRLRAADQSLTSGALGSRPLIVVTRGPDKGKADDAATGDAVVGDAVAGDAVAGDRVWLAWRDLHRDLARLSSNSRHIISASSDHYLNTADPDLLIKAIGEVVRSARSGTPLGQPVTASDGE
jgi:pimeloyl-ACP methyl ester carboxylesterase